MKYERISKLCVSITIITLLLFITLFMTSSMYQNNDSLPKNGSTKSIDPLSTNLYPVNNDGLTYGYDIYTMPASQSPDLMAAYGMNGTFGYVKASDYESNPRTPEEAIKQQKSNKGKIIYLYDKDGKTIIGVFDILE